MSNEFAEGQSCSNLAEPNTRNTKKRINLSNQNAFKVGLILLTVGVSIGFMQHRVPAIMLDLMGMFQMDAGTASWMMSIFVLVGVFVSIPVGNLAQRFGFKKMLLGAIALAVLGALVGILAGFLFSGALLIFSRALEGIALTVITICGPIGVTICVRQDRRGTAMSLFGIWGSIGASIAAVVSPIVFGQLGFAWVWLITILFALLAAVLLWLGIKVPKGTLEGEASSQSPEVPLDEQVTDSSLKDPPRYRELATGNMVLFLLGFVCFGMILLAFLSYMPSILRSKGYDPALAGFITTFPMLLSIISAPVFGMISDRIGKVKPLLVFSFAFFGPAAFIMFISTGTLLWVGALLLGLMGTGCFGLLISGYQDVLPRPELISIGMGVFILAQSVGQFFGAYLIQFLVGPGVDQFIPSGIALLVFGLLGTACFFFARYR